MNSWGEKKRSGTGGSGKASCLLLLSESGKKGKEKRKRRIAGGPVKRERAEESLWRAKGTRFQ